MRHSIAGAPLWELLFTIFRTSGPPLVVASSKSQGCPPPSSVVPDSIVRRSIEGHAFSHAVLFSTGGAMTTATVSRTDEQIQKDVLAELKWEPRVLPNEIGVAVKDGIVTLSGWVDSYVKRWAAEEAAHRVSGVKAVANDVEVRLPMSAERTDADI